MKKEIRQFSLALPNTLIVKLDKVAKETSLSRSVIIRLCITEALEKISRKYGEKSES